MKDKCILIEQKEGSNKQRREKSNGNRRNEEEEGNGEEFQYDRTGEKEKKKIIFSSSSLKPLPASCSSHLSFSSFLSLLVSFLPQFSVPSVSN